MIPSPDSFLPWWYDELVQSYLQTWQGVVSLIIGSLTMTLASWVAGWQFKIMLEQTKMMREQTESSKRQEAIAIKQGEIAEYQHRIMQEQLARKSELKVCVSSVGIPVHEGFSQFKIYIQNAGTRSDRDFHWEIYIPSKAINDGSVQVSLFEMTRGQTPVAVANHTDEGLYWLYFGTLAKTIHRRRGFELGYVLQKNIGTRLRWSIDSEDGTFPQNDTAGIVENCS